ncbi:hypothetical protein ABC974_11745 [Sphingomonas oligophenolica]|uniref:Uncharacterized protein n=1 Tax=Sphingomonas oligophenolica TaxID=301154 RepID=A0ABU9Y3F9_9SPHN
MSFIGNTKQVSAAINEADNALSVTAVTAEVAERDRRHCWSAAQCFSFFSDRPLLRGRKIQADCVTATDIVMTE